MPVTDAVDEVGPDRGPSGLTRGRVGLTLLLLVLVAGSAGALFSACVRSEPGAPIGRPSAGCVLTVRCEAENATLAGTRVETPGPGLWPGYSGSNFVVGFEHPDTSIRWLLIDVPAARKGVIDVRYSNYQGQDKLIQQRTLTLLVNDVRRKVQLPTTHSWSAWSDLVIRDVPLKAGDNVIQLEVDTDDSGRVNVDFLQVY